MKTVSEIKKKYQDRLQEFWSINREEIGCSYKTDIKLKRFSIVVGGRGSYAATIVEKTETLLEISVQEEFISSSLISYGMEESTLTEVVDVLCSYWRDYAKLKGIESVWYKVRPNSDVEDAMKSLQIPNIQILLETTSQCASNHSLYGYVNDEELLFTEKVQSLQEEIFKELGENKGFVLVNKNKFFKKKFMIEKDDYYFFNEYFFIEVVEKTGMIQLVTNEIKAKKFPLNPGVLKAILSYIEEERGMLNAVHPPIHYFKKLLGEMFVRLEKEEVEGLLLGLDEVLGRGKTEEEAEELLYWFNVRNQLSGRQFSVEGKEEKEVGLKNNFYKTGNSNLYTLYKIKTSKYIWYILVVEKDELGSLAKEIYFYPTQPSEIFPKDVKEKIGELLEERMSNVVCPSISH